MSAHSRVAPVWTPGAVGGSLVAKALEAFAQIAKAAEVPTL